MTRLLDRYVLGIFLPALAMFTLTLLFLVLAVDFAAKLGKFLELKTEPVLPFVLLYYAVRIPMWLAILIPSVLLFAPTFTVIKLARANELLPIATSGTSLRRMSRPFLVAAVFGAAAIASIEEFVLPMLEEHITTTDRKFAKRGFEFNSEVYDGHTKISAKKYDIDPPLFYGEVRITRLDATTKHPIEIITAQRVSWDAKLKRWTAFDGQVEQPNIMEFPPGSKPRVKKDPIPQEGVVIETRLTPESIRRDMGATNRQAFAPLSVLIYDMKRNAHVPAAVLRVHSRFSFPLSPIVLLLVGLPFVVDPQSKSLIKGLIFCFLLALGYYGTHFACVDLGNKGSIPPIVAAWFPTAAFGAAGLIAFARMRT